MDSESQRLQREIDQTMDEVNRCKTQLESLFRAWNLPSSEIQLPEEIEWNVEGMGEEDVKSLVTQISSVSWYERLAMRGSVFGLDLLKCFKPREEINQSQPKPTQIKLKKLRKDTARLSVASGSVFGLFNGISDILLWAHPFQTFVIFCTLAYVTWKEMLLSSLLFLIIIQLGLNYCHAILGISTGINLMPLKCTRITSNSPENSDSESESNDSISASLSWADLTFADLADILAWIRGIFEWEDPVFTKKIWWFFISLFFLSFFLSASYFLIFFVFSLLIRFFILSYVYRRFPRVGGSTLRVRTRKKEEESIKMKADRVFQGLMKKTTKKDV